MFVLLSLYIICMIILYTKNPKYNTTNKVEGFFYTISEGILDYINYKKLKQYKKMYRKNLILHKKQKANEITRIFFIKSLGQSIFVMLIILVIATFMKPSKIIKVSKINIENNKIKKSNFLEGSTDGYIRGIVSKGDYSEEGIYKIKVNEKQPTDEQAVDRLDKILNENLVKGENENLLKVTKDLYLPVKNDYNADISWTSDDSCINTETGEVKQNPKGEGDIDATLNLTISKNEVVKSKKFYVTVKESKISRNQIEVKNGFNKLDLYIDEEIKINQKENIELPNKINECDVKWYEQEVIERTSDNRPVLIVIGILLLAYLINKNYSNIEESLKKRKQEIELDFSSFLNKFILLVNAGLNTRAAIKKIIKGSSSRSYLYVELRKLQSDIDKGIHEMDAYNTFARRCNSIYINKFISNLTQSIKKGSDIREALEEQVKETFANRKNVAKKLGEEASTKLIFPLMIIFVAIMLLVIYPAVISIKF